MDLGAYEYEFIIIPILCISDDTSSTLCHHVPHFRPITYPTRRPSHSSGGRALDSRYRPPVIQGARVRDASALDLLQPPDGDGLWLGQRPQPVEISECDKEVHANIYGKKYS